MVPIIEFSDMFCCEQLSPNESKQICVLQPYLEVRLYLGDMGLIFRNPVDCVCSVSQGPASSVFEYGYLCASRMCSHGEMSWLARKKQNQHHRGRSRFNTKGMFGRGRGLLFPLLDPLHHNVGWERNQTITLAWENSYVLPFLLTRECVSVKCRTTSLYLGLLQHCSIANQHYRTKLYGFAIPALTCISFLCYLWVTHPQRSSLHVTPSKAKSQAHQIDGSDSWGLVGAWYVFHGKQVDT